MNIAGIGKAENLYPFLRKKAEPAKVEDAQAARLSRKDTINITERDGAAYYETLRQNFACVKNGKVSISGAYLDRCAKDPELAGSLEENLAAYENCVQRSYQNAKMSAQAAGGKLLSYSETWSIDEKGNLTMFSCGTVEYDTGTKSWEEIRKDTLKHMEKARKEKAEKKTAPSAGKENEKEVSESHGGKVAVNESKRSRQIAAAKSRNQLQQVMALLHKDMSDCKAGLEKGWCDDAEIAKVQALLNSAQARLSQVPQKAEEEPGISEFDLAGLM